MQLMYISHFGRILLGIDWKDFGFNIAKQISVQKTKRDTSEGQQSMSAGLENDLKTSVRELNKFEFKDNIYFELFKGLLARRKGYINKYYLN